MTELPSIHRALRGLPPEHQALLIQRYERITPILLRLLKPRDIAERNRAWPGVSPIGKAATKLLLTKNAGKVRRAINRRASITNDQQDQLWSLIRAYCQYGPIALLEAIETSLQPLIAEELLELARFHRLGKHPRTDAGTYIRELLNHYAEELGLQPLPNFVARYAFVTNRKLKRWFLPDEEKTEHVPKTVQRLNLDLPYPHEQWNAYTQQLELTCILAERHQQKVAPWLVWIEDAHTGILQGWRLCANRPSLQDFLLALRWSIWHYEAPWWPSRGIPDTLNVPISLTDLTSDSQRALTYIHTELIEQLTLRQESLPEPVNNWVEQRSRRLRDPLTLKQCQVSLLSYFQEYQASLLSAKTPLQLSEQGVSLPWGMGIASALLLPSAGECKVNQGLLSIRGIPYDAAKAGLQDGRIGDVRYDPDDARSIHFILGKANVIKIEAARFEGARIVWFELVQDPTTLN